METKTCKQCGKSFHRPTQKDGKLLRLDKWRLRVYCDNDCRTKAQTITITNVVGWTKWNKY